MSFFDCLTILLYCAALLGIILVFAWACDRLGIKPRATAPVTPAVPAAPDPQWMQFLVQTDYVYVGLQLIRCVGQQMSLLGLARPGDLALHMPVDDCLVCYREQVGIVFRYVFDRAIDLRNGGCLNLDRLPLSTVSPEFIGEKLAASFPNYCRTAGLGDYGVLSVTDIPDGKICIEVLRRF